MASDEDYEWTISPQACKNLLGVLNDLDKLFPGIDIKDGGPLAAALLMSMAVERAALMRIQAAEKMEIMKAQGGSKVIKI